MNNNIVFPDRISFLCGDSGTGKSFLVEALNKQGLAIEVFDHRDLHNLFLSKHNFVDIEIKGNDISFVSKF